MGAMVAQIGQLGSSLPRLTRAALAQPLPIQGLGFCPVRGPLADDTRGVLEMWLCCESPPGSLVGLNFTRRDFVFVLRQVIDATEAQRGKGTWPGSHN